MFTELWRFFFSIYFECWPVFIFLMIMALQTMQIGTKLTTQLQVENQRTDSHWRRCSKKRSRAKKLKVNGFDSRACGNTWEVRNFLLKGSSKEKGCDNRSVSRTECCSHATVWIPCTTNAASFISGRGNGQQARAIVGDDHLWCKQTQNSTLEVGIQGCNLQKASRQDPARCIWSEISLRSGTQISWYQVSVWGTLCSRAWI